VEHELARRQVVVRPAVDPEELRVALDLAQRAVVGRRRVREDRLDHVAHLETIRGLLIVEDVAPRDCRLRQVPHQDPLVERPAREPVGVQLHDGRVVDALEQIPPRVGLRGRRGLACTRGAHRKRATADRQSDA
jgi:hypothetical protein